MSGDVTEVRWKEMGEKKKRETGRQDSSLVGSRPCSVAVSRDEDDGMNYGSVAMTEQRWALQPIKSQTGGDRCADMESNSSSWFPSKSLKIRKHQHTMSKLIEMFTETSPLVQKIICHLL